MTERIAIVGSRQWGSRWPEIRDRVRALVASLPADAVVVSGGAVGVDLCAQIAAEKRGLAVSIHLPDYERHGSAAAPHIRNRRIAEDCTRGVAFWNGKMPSGTMGTVKLIEGLGKMCEVER